MLNIFKFMKKEAGWIAIIFVLLVGQAYCDLALPQYTSDIVNVGIAKYGIDSNVPENITADTYNAAKQFMTSENAAIVDSFYDEAQGYNVASYKLNTTKDEDLDKIDVILSKPIMAVFMLQQSGEMSLEMLPMLPSEAKNQILDKVTETFETMGDSTVSTMLSQVIISEKDALGIDKSDQQISYMVKVGLKMLLIALIIMLSTIIVGFIASKVAARIGMDLRLNIFKNVVSFSSTEMDKFSTASLITRSTNDVQQVQMVTVMLLRMVLYAPILGIGGIWKVMNSNGSMSWIIAAAVGAILIVVLTLMVAAMPKFKKMQSLVDRVNLVEREILTGLPVIRAFSREKHEEERFEQANIDLTKTQLFTSRVMALMMPIMMFIMNVVSVAIIWFGGKGIDSGSLQVGDMIAFMTYTMQIVMSFLMITMISIMLPRAGVAANRIQEVLDTKPSIHDPKVAEKTTGKGVVEFKNVSFAYPNAKENVIENITFTAKPGQTTAIIGSTGNGKSTLVNLIPRLYDVSGGEIDIDGVDIRKMTQHDLRDMIGFVPQKSVLFSGTIDSNIRFGCPDTSAENVVKAASIAQAEDFINEKNEKYDSPIAQGGSNVSGGQKQRLSIARAIAKEPKIYVFDDSFSALDYKTDVVLRQALKEETGDATVIIVAQRISTILHAEQIIVLDDGKISGIGTHKELLKNNEIYRQIATSQLSAADIEMIDSESIEESIKSGKED